MSKCPKAGASVNRCSCFTISLMHRLSFMARCYDLSLFFFFFAVVSGYTAVSHGVEAASAVNIVTKALLQLPLIKFCFNLQYPTHLYFNILTILCQFLYLYYKSLNASIDLALFVQRCPYAIKTPQSSYTEFDNSKVQFKRKKLNEKHIVAFLRR